MYLLLMRWLIMIADRVSFAAFVAHFSSNLIFSGAFILALDFAIAIAIAFALCASVFPVCSSGSFKRIDFIHLKRNA